MLLAQLLFRAAALEEVLDRLKGLVGDRDEKSWPTKMSSSPAFSRPTERSKTGKCRTMKR